MITETACVAEFDYLLKQIKSYLTARNHKFWNLRWNKMKCIMIGRIWQIITFFSFSLTKKLVAAICGKKTARSERWQNGLICFYLNSIKYEFFRMQFLLILRNLIWFADGATYDWLIGNWYLWTFFPTKLINWRWPCTMYKFYRFLSEKLHYWMSKLLVNIFQKNLPIFSYTKYPHIDYG